MNHHNCFILFCLFNIDCKIVNLNNKYIIQYTYCTIYTQNTNILNIFLKEFKCINKLVL